MKRQSNIRACLTALAMSAVLAASCGEAEPPSPVLKTVEPAQDPQEQIDRLTNGIVEGFVEEHDLSKTETVTINGIDFHIYQAGEDDRTISAQKLYDMLNTALLDLRFLVTDVNSSLSPAIQRLLQAYDLSPEDLDISVLKGKEIHVVFVGKVDGMSTCWGESPLTQYEEFSIPLIMTNDTNVCRRASFAVQPASPNDGIASNVSLLAFSYPPADYPDGSIEYFFHTQEEPLSARVSPQEFLELDLLHEMLHWFLNYAKRPALTDQERREDLGYEHGIILPYIQTTYKSRYAPRSRSRDTMGNRHNTDPGWGRQCVSRITPGSTRRNIPRARNPQYRHDRHGHTGYGGTRHRI